MIPACRDCKHVLTTHGPFFDQCAKHDKEADPSVWAHGIERIPLYCHDARQGPCGREGNDFVRRVTFWKSLLRQVTSEKP